MTHPRVSIITPVRNRASLIETTIQNVLDQQRPDVEHVIVDGASNDGTKEILERYHARYPDRVRYVSEPDRGGCEGFNKGCAMARGQILGWLGSDDMYRPDAIRQVVDHFDAHPADQVVYGEADFVDLEGRVIGRFATRDFSVERAVNQGACVIFPTVFYRRSVVAEVGGFRIGDLVCDHEWLVRVGKRFAMTRLPIAICQFRLHPGSTTAALGPSLYPRGEFYVCLRHGGSLLSTVAMRFYQSLLFKVPGVRLLWEQLVMFRGFAGRLRAADRRIAVFGAARSGFEAMAFLESAHRDVPIFIDNWPPESATYCDRPVCTPADFMAGWREKVDAVMVATAPGSRYAPVMRRQLRSLGFNRPIYCSRYSR